MTQREKNLAIAVGGLVAILVLFFGWNRLREGFDQKNTTIESLQRTILSNQTMVTQGALARKRINELALRSLPSDVEVAKTAYSEWLIKFANASKLQNAKPLYISDVISPTKTYNILTFKLEGDARLDDIVRILHAFYDYPYLHKITGFNLGPKPKADYGVMAIKLDIQVAAMKDASPKQAPPDQSKYKLIEKSAEDYLATIVERNIFSPANLPPAWSQTASTTAVRGTSLSYSLSAKDPDEKQSVQYELVSTTATGASIQNGQLVWSPQEVGKYEAVVKATDTGLPAASSTQTIVINVTDPPPPPPPATPKPKFDVATQTRVTALLSGSKGPEAWFTSHIEGKMVTVRVGDQFELAGIQGKVTEIGSTFVELETDGQRWIVGQDESLADAFRRRGED